MQAKGAQAATMISTALQGMGLGANPWAKLGSGVVRRKPHKGADRAYQAMLDAQVRLWGRLRFGGLGLSMPSA